MGDIRGILEAPSTGNCELNIDEICMNDWLPKIDRTYKKLCRDAFISHHTTTNTFRLVFVRGYRIVTKITISPQDARLIIDNLGLTDRSSFLRSSRTYRLTWFHVDYLEVNN